jgi:hypothetical protein
MYSPKIDEGLIPTLYRLAKERKVPMTRLVNEILRNALENNFEDPVGAGSHPEGNSSGSLR